MGFKGCILQEPCVVVGVGGSGLPVGGKGSRGRGEGHTIPFSNPALTSLSTHHPLKDFCPVPGRAHIALGRQQAARAEKVRWRAGMQMNSDQTLILPWGTQVMLRPCSHPGSQRSPCTIPHIRAPCLPTSEFEVPILSPGDLRHQVFSHHGLKTLCLPYQIRPSPHTVPSTQCVLPP